MASFLSCTVEGPEGAPVCVFSADLPEPAQGREGFYVTGDKAEDNKDGTFVLIGRADGIVKVAGKRVDLIEVEQKIKSLSFVKDAFVFSLSSKSVRGQEIAALLVTNEDKALIRKTLSRILDPICIPKRFARVKAIPMTPAGKRDREKAVRLLT
jgi:acyl-coenzyme A synthetase/AMP-(fatty) acid ligase